MAAGQALPDPPVESYPILLLFPSSPTQLPLQIPSYSMAVHPLRATSGVPATRGRCATSSGRRHDHARTAPRQVDVGAPAKCQQPAVASLLPKPLFLLADATGRLPLRAHPDARQASHSLVGSGASAATVRGGRLRRRVGRLPEPRHQLPDLLRLQRVRRRLQGQRQARPQLLQFQVNTVTSQMYTHFGTGMNERESGILEFGRTPWLCASFRPSCSACPTATGCSN